ncbi:hypothetical protein VNO77_00337 [Canavalia gladiata]|uniref:Uncharacterized protein n=1 Tax=Canavalia gladiata TaxID=3824 RepID=A0AAN9MP76_CANGL
MHRKKARREDFSNVVLQPISCIPHICTHKLWQPVRFDQPQISEVLNLLVLLLDGVNLSIWCCPIIVPYVSAWNDCQNISYNLPKVHSDVCALLYLTGASASPNGSTLHLNLNDSIDKKKENLNDSPFHWD